MFEKPVTHEVITTHLFKYRQSKDDPNYGSCLWADFTIDISRNLLSITSDCGNMQYRWTGIGDEPFPSFLAGLNREYLLCKLSKKSKFNFDETVKWMTELFQEDKDYVKHIRDITPCATEGDFAHQLLGHPSSHADDLEAIVMDYPVGHQRVVDIFCKYVQPALKEEE